MRGNGTMYLLGFFFFFFFFLNVKGQELEMLLSKWQDLMKSWLRSERLGEQHLKWAQPSVRLIDTGVIFPTGTA